MNKKISLLLLCFAVFALLTYSQQSPGQGANPDGPGGPGGPGGKPGGNPGGKGGNPSGPNTGTPQAPSTGDQAQVQALTVKPPMNWYCDIEFYYNGKSYYTESLSYGDSEAYRGSLSGKLDNKIDAVYWDGTRCYCWVVLYQGKYWNGLNLGLWTDSTSGSYDLYYYITYDWSSHAWEPWDQTVSSYAIYCY